MESVPPSHEILNPPNAWIFDVDGTISNPIEKRITQDQIIFEIAKRLEANQPVAFVSGRAMPWIQERVIERIAERVDNPSCLGNIFVSAEFGGVTGHFIGRNFVLEVDQSIKLPVGIINEAGKIVNGKFVDSIFVDPDKQTHFSAEMKKGISIELFHQKQKDLSAKLEQLISPVAETVEIHNDRIATNVKNKKLNKHFAMQKVLNWLVDRRINPMLFYVFGDSKSDLEMGKELYSQGKSLVFIYVGDDVVEKMPFEVVKTREFLDKGTLEFLQNFK